MPAKSKAQFRYIQGLKAKYKNKANTPKTHKWIWDKEWTEDINYKSLPDKVDEKDKRDFKGDIQIISYIDSYEVLEILVNGKKYTIDYVSRKLYDQLNKEKDSYHRFLLLNKYYPEIINKDILKESIESIQDYFYQFATDEEKKKWESNNRTGQLPIQSEFEKVKGNRVNLIRGIDAPLITIGTMTEKDKKEEDEDIEGDDSGSGDIGESIINEGFKHISSFTRLYKDIERGVSYELLDSSDLYNALIDLKEYYEDYMKWYNKYTDYNKLSKEEQQVVLNFKKRLIEINKAIQSKNKTEKIIAIDNGINELHVDFPVLHHIGMSVSSHLEDDDEIEKAEEEMQRFLEVIEQLLIKQGKNIDAHRYKERVSFIKELNEANEFTQSMFRTLDEVFQNITDCINNLETSPKETKVVLLQTKALFNGMTNNILTECNANIAKLNKDNNQQKTEDEPTEEE